MNNDRYLLYIYLITYLYIISSKERALRVISRWEGQGLTYTPSGPFHIPSTDYSEIAEQHRSYGMYTAVLVVFIYV